ncbi:Trishanku [Paramyrothecium foliicola]|nr:Trishanku [Paramyrothecium foliicola]
MAESQDQRVVLRVGERKFFTTKSTLTTESAYFATRFSRWDDADTDRSYFIDGDPDIFEHILRYLRTSKPPLFFDQHTQTHDLAKYAALLGEARYFQMPALESWILKKKYLQVIQTKISLQIFDDSNVSSVMANTTELPSTSTIEIFSSSGTRKRLVCPLECVMGYRHSCGSHCLDQKSPAYGFEDTPCFNVLVVRRDVTFNPELL